MPAYPCAGWSLSSNAATDVEPGPHAPSSTRSLVRDSRRWMSIGEGSANPSHRRVCRTKGRQSWAPGAASSHRRTRARFAGRCSARSISSATSATAKTCPERPDEVGHLLGGLGRDMTAGGRDPGLPVAPGPTPGQVVCRLAHDIRAEPGPVEEGHVRAHGGNEPGEPADVAEAEKADDNGRAQTVQCAGGYRGDPAGGGNGVQGVCRRRRRCRGREPPGRPLRGDPEPRPHDARPDAAAGRGAATSGRPSSAAGASSSPPIALAPGQDRVPLGGSKKSPIGCSPTAGRP